MTWIKLHSYGKECWCDFPNHIHLERNAEGGTCVYRSGTASYHESPEQIIALIVEAGRGAKGEPPKIDARKIEELCDDLQAQSKMFGAYSIQYPSLKASIERRIEEIRSAIRKELGL